MRDRFDGLIPAGISRQHNWEGTVSIRQGSTRRRPLGSKRSLRPLLENLEARLVLSHNPHLNLNLMEFHDPSRVPAGVTPSPLGILPLDGGLPFPIGYEPVDLSIAYGIGNIKFGSVTGDGSGQTIAIVDAYDDPSFVNEFLSNGNLNPDFANSDLAQFDSQVGIADPPSFTKVNESGKTSPLPGTDPAGAGISTATGRSKRPSTSNGLTASRRGPTSFWSKRPTTVTQAFSPRSRRRRVFRVSRQFP